MKKCGGYILAQLKRVCRVFPSVLGTTFLLLGCMALLALVLLRQDGESEDKQKIQIGLAGDIEGSFLGIGIHTVQNLDSSRFTISFVDMTEEEAKKQLMQGKISAYVVVPENFVESVSSGENKPVTYVTSLGAPGIGSLVMNEVVDVISKLIVESQNAIYGMQRLLVLHEMQDIYWESTEEMYFQFIDFILGRTGIYEMEILGVSNSLSFTSYYMCGILVLFLLLWGIACSPLFVKRDLALPKLLAARGQKAFWQVLGEYMAYVALMLATLTFVVLLLVIGMKVTGFTLPEWKESGVGELLWFCCKMLPVVLVLSAMQFLFYEIISGMVSAILLQFIAALCLGYLSGCFYPISFFPTGIQKLSQILPTGAALQYAGNCLLQKDAAGSILVMGIYFTVFLALATAVRNHKIKNG